MTLLYFAWVRQKIGRSEETLVLSDNIETVADLISFLKTRGVEYAEAFADLDRIRVAVNQDHSGFDTSLHDSDEIAFFPPVTGG